jgi:hypothetical protein
VLLHVLRKDVVQDLLHLLPEFGLLVLQVCGHQVHAFPLLTETHVGPPVGDGISVHLDVSGRGLKLLRVQDVEDGAGVVDGREGEFIVGEVHSLILLEHVMDCLGEGNMLKPFKVVEHVLCSHVLMSHL